MKVKLGLQWLDNRNGNVKGLAGIEGELHGAACNVFFFVAEWLRLGFSILVILSGPITSLSAVKSYSKLPTVKWQSLIGPRLVAVEKIPKRI